MLSFQKITSSLIQFWSNQGCLHQQGYDIEKGAGTFNIDSFFRVLGPEHYAVVNTELCRRPTDGRYGTNPNRLQKFCQLQVVIKPSPADIFSLYLQSLEAIGLVLSEHDIRFVHDDWEAPTQGASGVGWEVWCDGMEVTQFTYFQMMAGYELDPISVELAYGIERLTMFLQNKKNIYDIQFDQRLSYGDIYLQGEKEWSRYNFEEADVAILQRHFVDFEYQAMTLCNKALPLPAYDYALKASHTFNLLDARGAISVTERTRYIHSIRNLSCNIAKTYLTEREKLGFPLLKYSRTPIDPPIPHSLHNASFHPDRKDDCLLEIGSEELPDSYVMGGAASFERAVRKLLQEHQLYFEDLQVFGTPRRIGVLIRRLAEGSYDIVNEKRGPPVTVAFDQGGQPTAAALGFFSSLQIPPYNQAAIASHSVSELSIKEDGYLYAHIHQKGSSTLAILSKHLPPIIAQIHFPKKMHWSEGPMYARPIRWIAALYGKEVVPFSIGKVHAGNITYGHRQRCPRTVELKHPREYFEKLRKVQVIADALERKIFINEQLLDLEKELGCHALKRDLVINQVVQLSEYPSLAAYQFDKKYLSLPPEILMSEMIHHQKLFPCADSSGHLTHTFIATLDRPPTPLILENNKAVLTARLADGNFTYEQDIKYTLDDFNLRLRQVTFQKDLGSLYDKVLRMKRHVIVVAKMLANPIDASILTRAAEVCKADLASSMVGEFPELQGIIGNYYAIYHKEPIEVARAIEEHWMPVCENGVLPTTPVGQVLAIVDKLDNLLGYYLIGIRPSSSKDPYALRRAALGVLRILIEKQLSLDVPSLLEILLSHFPQSLVSKSDNSSVLHELEQFFTQRFKTILLEYEFHKQEIEAVLSQGCQDPYDRFCRIKALREYREEHEEFAQLQEAYKRARGQTDKQAVKVFDTALLVQEEERALASMVTEQKTAIQHAITSKNYLATLDHLAKLQPYLEEFFAHVKVLDDEQKIQDNRIALLQDVLNQFSRVLDFGKL